MAYTETPIISKQKEHRNPRAKSHKSPPALDGVSKSLETESHATEITLPEDPTDIVAAEFNPNDPALSWDEIRDHAKSKCLDHEQIGAVIVQIVETGDDKQKSRFIDYCHPRVDHHITVNTGANLTKQQDLHVQQITIINTGEPNTEYRLYNPPGVWVCQ